MLWWHVLVAIFSVLMCALHWKKRKFRLLEKYAKNEITELPIVGHAYIFLGSDEDRMNAFKALGRQAIKHGGITSAWMIHQFYIVVADPDVAKIILKTCLEKGYVTQFMKYVLGNGSIFAPVSIWRPRRKILAPTFSPKNLSQFAKIFSKQSGVMAEQLRSAASKGPFSVWSYLTTYTMDSVCESTLGVQMNTQKNPDQPFLKAFDDFSQLVAARMCQPWLYSDIVYKMLPVFKQLSKAKNFMCSFIDQIIQNKRKCFKDEENEKKFNYKLHYSEVPHRYMLLSLHALRREVRELKFQVQIREANFTNVHELIAPRKNLLVVRRSSPVFGDSDDKPRKCNQYLEDIVGRFLKIPSRVIVPGSCALSETSTNSESENKNELLDFYATQETTKEEKESLRTFLELIMESSGGEKGYTDLELQEETLVMVIAGTDTSAVGTAFTTVILSRHPDVQEKIYDELQEVFGDSPRPIVNEDLSRLKYLDAVVKESLRLYPPVPVTARLVTKDITLPSGHTVLAGTNVIINMWAIHRNPLYWGPDAEQFRPERFLDPQFVHPAQFMPFSYGPRNCLGYQYAMMSMKTALSTLLRQYRVLPAVLCDTASNGNCKPKQHRPLRVKFDIMMKDVDNFIIELEPRE